ncbi:MAG: hypothetical protein OES38_13835 [Gammaproteobacteria bacterium]|nr:hypothetical protein [Gammaproteobacteria bacterium]
MRRHSFGITAMLLATALCAPLAHSDSHSQSQMGAVATMANIVIGLQHFPSDADKAALAAIAEGDASSSVKAVARAIANISHKVSADDQATLATIAADESEPAELRELASIVNGVNHVPSAEAVAALQGLASH